MSMNEREPTLLEHSLMAGDKPKRQAQAFLKAAGLSDGYQGHELVFLVAFASSSIHNVQVSSKSHEEKQAALLQILLTAQAAEVILWERRNEDDEQEECGGIALKEKLERLVFSLLDKPQAAIQRRNTARKAKERKEASGAAAAEPPASAKPSASAVPPADGPSVAGAPSASAGPSAAGPSLDITKQVVAAPAVNGLALPPPLVELVLMQAGAQAAANAAAACKQLAAMHRSLARIECTAAFRLYLEACREMKQRTEDNEEDGSREAASSMKVPLDGSPVCGIELCEDASSREMLRLFDNPAMRELLAMMRRPDHNENTEEKFQEIKAKLIGPRSPPSPSSSPLAAFKTSSPPVRMLGPTPSAAAAGPFNSYVAHACCDITNMSFSMGPAPGAMHLDGDLLSACFGTGWKQRDPGLALMVIAGDGDYDEASFDTGFFSHGTHVCSDSSNGLVWCAADDGKRVKAFRAPVEAATRDAACNQAEFKNKLQLQYTLSTDIKGLGSRHAGLHVQGTQAMVILGNGALLMWDLANMPPQRNVSHPTKVPGYDDSDDDDDSDEDEDDDGASMFSAGIGFRDTEDPDELEVSKGTAPHTIHLLPSPGPSRGARSINFINRTCLLADPATSSPSLAVAIGDRNSYGQSVVVYDLEVGRVKQTFGGHLMHIEDMAPAPAQWQQPHLFATCSRGGDVKVWDMRARGSAAAITLCTGDTDVMNAVVLAGSCPEAAGGSQLGAGMVCFAGGACESVFAWDLRQGGAETLYELSTGNCFVEALAWHAPTNSLIASCTCVLENRMGQCYKDDFTKVGQAAHNDEDSEDDDDGEGQWWPKGARHAASDFRAPLNIVSSTTLRYWFRADAKQEVPMIEEPCFAGEGGW